jgi:thiol:disulfide interchange protein/DsbC/DsbD-like thiol-disulfide interchange protein
VAAPRLADNRVFTPSAMRLDGSRHDAEPTTAMISIRPLLVSLLVAAPAGLLAATPGAVVSTPEVRAELLAHAPEGVATGKPLWLGLDIQHQPHWHTYWKNPGDSGLPTSFEWSLPAGVTAGEIEWPTPKKLPIGPLLNYGYEGRVLLAVPVSVPAGFAADRLDVRLQANWLVCKEVCIPQSGEFAISVPAQAATAGGATLFEAARAALPQPAAGARASAEFQGQELVVRVAGLPAAWQGRVLDFLPEMPGVLQNVGTPEAAWQGGEWSVRLPVDAQRSASPATLPALLTTAPASTALRIDVQVKTPWPTVAAPPSLREGVPLTAPPAAPPLGLLAALALALVGGALLNLMPCVFPVLSLKLIGFAAHAEDRRKLLAGGLSYTAGVVLSFVALAALLLVLRAGGEQLGWGFQLQSPAVVAGLAALFTLIGLNLAGAFEFGSLLPADWAAARARHPLVDSLLTGVLAVAVASPCTAPFMGASLGAAVTLPAAQALAVFAAVGLGMALPYLLASAWPALARLLPRPGVWMQHFKTLMAFPMFATVVWLVWVLGQQAGVDAIAALLATLVALSFVAWALGSPALGRRARWGFGAASLLLLAVALAWALPTLRESPGAPTRAEAGWEPWSEARAAELAVQGRPVFVDFTAAWCVTCQLNKRTTLGRPEVLADFAKHGVVLLRADWTRRDADITAELTRLGRSGVPVYALYAPGLAPPRVLSEILSVGEVRQMLAGLP